MSRFWQATFGKVGESGVPRSEPDDEGGLGSMSKMGEGQWMNPSLEGGLKLQQLEFGP